LIKSSQYILLNFSHYIFFNTAFSIITSFLTLSINFTSIILNSDISTAYILLVCFFFHTQFLLPYFFSWFFPQIYHRCAFWKGRGLLALPYSFRLFLLIWWMIINFGDDLFDIVNTDLLRKKTLVRSPHSTYIFCVHKDVFLFWIWVFKMYLLPTLIPLSRVGSTCFHHVVIKIRQLFLHPAAFLTSTLLKTEAGANDCKFNDTKGLTYLPKHGGARDNKFLSPIL
jgi:hypothetical protein